MSPPQAAKLNRIARSIEREVERQLAHLDVMDECSSTQARSLHREAAAACECNIEALERRANTLARQ